MKKITSMLIALLLLATFGLFAIGSGSSEGTTEDQGNDTAATKTEKSNLSDCNIEIKSCRLAKDYDGKKVVIITYGFTNYADDAASFNTAVEDAVFQNGIGLNEAYILSESANYNADNQIKEIKKEATLDVEVAYELNDETTDITVEVTEWFSLDDKKITKTFTIA